MSVTRFWKAGNVQYAKVPELRGVDLNAYRAKSREGVRVTVKSSCNSRAAYKRQPTGNQNAIVSPERQKG